MPYPVKTFDMSQAMARVSKEQSRALLILSVITVRTSGMTENHTADLIKFV